MTFSLESGARAVSGEPAVSGESTEARADLVAGLLAAGRRLGTATVLFHQSIAERAGLSAPDHKYLDLLLSEGPMPAGRFADLTGLTTGAVTGVIDRLEAAGFAQREKDPSDRRKVIIRPLTAVAEHQIGPLFVGLVHALSDLNARYSNEELRLIQDYMTHCTTVLREQTHALRTRTEEI